jgi:hypothetical protein
VQEGSIRSVAHLAGGQFDAADVTSETGLMLLREAVPKAEDHRHSTNSRLPTLPSGGGTGGQRTFCRARTASYFGRVLHAGVMFRSGELHRALYAVNGAATGPGPRIHCDCRLMQWEQCGVLGRADVQDFALVFVMAGDAGADRQVGAALDEQFANFGVDTLEVGQSVEDRSLSPGANGVNVGAGVDISAAIRQGAGGIEVTELGSYMKPGRSAECEQTAS